MATVTNTHAPKGLEGVVATTSSICYIDGDLGVLAYRGYDIHDLADNSTFEEVCHLLWFGRLPNAAELIQLKQRMAEERKLDASIFYRLQLVPKHVPPMDVLRTLVSALSYYDPEYDKNDHDANINKAIRLTSQLSMLVASYDRIRNGQPVVSPDRSLSHAANFLLMLNGVAPSKTAERALDIALILHADHELNASTFAARVTAATLSDMHSAVTSAIGTLKGPLHGGANEAVFKILQEIDANGADPVEYVKGLAGAEEKNPRLRTPRLSHGRSARHPFAADVARPGSLERQSEVVRVFAKDRGIREVRQEPQRECGFLFGFYLSHAGNRGGLVYADLRGVSRGRMDRACDRTTRRQPADTAAGGLRWARISAEICAGGKALIQGQGIRNEFPVAVQCRTGAAEHAEKVASPGDTSPGARAKSDRNFEFFSAAKSTPFQSRSKPECSPACQGQDIGTIEAA